MFALHFYDCSLSFPYEIKTVVHSWISLTSQKPLMGVMTKLCTIKWFDFCLSITLTVIFKWLIKAEKWIIMYGS